MLDFIGFLSDFLMGSNPVISSKEKILSKFVGNIFLIKDEIIKRDLKARKENSPVDCSDCRQSPKRGFVFMEKSKKRRRKYGIKREETEDEKC